MHAHAVNTPTQWLPCGDLATHHTARLCCLISAPPPAKNVNTAGGFYHGFPHHPVCFMTVLGEFNLFQGKSKKVIHSKTISDGLNVDFLDGMMLILLKLYIYYT